MVFVKANFQHYIHDNFFKPMIVFNTDEILESDPYCFSRPANSKDTLNRCLWDRINLSERVLNT